MPEVWKIKPQKFQRLTTSVKFMEPKKSGIYMHSALEASAMV
jgi:hypothetical protein